MTVHTFSAEAKQRPPEIGWPPFIEWLRAQGLDPHVVRTISVDDTSMLACVVEFKLRDGKRYLRHGEVAVTDGRIVSVNSLPPRRLSA